MIEVKKLNGSALFVNPDLIRFVESNPDTVLTFLDGQKLMVKDKPTEVVAKIVEFRRLCQSPETLERGANEKFSERN
jgi:flagellar protein FlbD